MEVAAGVRRLGSRYTNFYLIEDQGRLTMLDAGLPGYWHHLLAELEAMGRTLEDIDAVLLTHHHPDHVGIAERVRRAAQAQVRAHVADAPFITGQRQAPRPNFIGQLWRPFVFVYLVRSILAGAARRTPVADLQTFADGEILDVPGRPRVIHMPGHTAGQCALLLESRRVLFSADALCTFDLLTGRPGPSVAPPFVNVNTRQALESLSAIEDVDADVILPGHGDPWRAGVADAVKMARGHVSRGAVEAAAGLAASR